MTLNGRQFGHLFSPDRQVVTKSQFFDSLIMCIGMLFRNFMTLHTKNTRQKRLDSLQMHVLKVIF